MFKRHRNNKMVLKTISVLRRLHRLKQPVWEMEKNKTTAKSLNFKEDDVITGESKLKYRSPTGKFFDKLSSEMRSIDETVARKT